MNCNCKWTQTILGLLILLVVIWPGIFSAVVNKWILIVVAILLVLHSFCCKSCGVHKHAEMPKKRRR